MTGWVRPAAAAGSYYPDDATALQRSVAGYLARAAPAPGLGAAKAVIAPHAGYRYSGPIAATAYAALTPARGVVRRVVLAGPAHRVPVEGVSLSSAGAFATPIGPVDVDAAACSAALSVDGVVVDDEAHAAEHSLEVHLPFIVETLGGDVKVLPLLAGDSNVLADVLDAIWGGQETRIVVSTDLSHYHDDATAKALDRKTAAAIVARRPEDIRPDQACGATAVCGLLEVARRHDLGVSLLDLRTSADTAGQPDRVVGYGAFALDDHACLLRVDEPSPQQSFHDASPGRPGSIGPSRPTSVRAG